MIAQPTTQAQALILLFKTMPKETQKEFVKWISESVKVDESIEGQEDMQFWLNASSDTLEDIWNAPEEDIWDEIYQKHQESERL